MLVDDEVRSCKKRRLRSSSRHHEAEDTLEAQEKSSFSVLVTSDMVIVRSDWSDERFKSPASRLSVQCQPS